MFFMGKGCKVVDSVYIDLGSCIGLITHLVHFASQMSHHASIFVAAVGMTLVVVTSLVRWREMQNSSLATGCTVSRVDSVGIANYNV